MNNTICRLSFRESGMYIVPVILILIGNVLFRQDPFRFWDTPIGILAVLLGFFLAWRTFADYGSIRAFLFSRSFSPARFFIVRWLFGLGVIAVTGIVMALLVLCGIRQGIQQLLFENGWFPMVRFEELHVLMSYTLTAFLTYHTTLYFMLTNRFRRPVHLHGISFWLRRLSTVLLTIYIGVVVCAVLFVAMMDAGEAWGNIDYPRMIEPFVYFIFGIPAILQTAIAPWFGIYCYSNQEIES